MNLFSTRDEQYHREQKRPIANAYSMTSLLTKEDAVDSCSVLFMHKLGEFADAKKPVDLGAWLQYYAFDVVGEFSFARKLGFLEKGTDVDGMMEAIEGMLVSGFDHILARSSLNFPWTPHKETFSRAMQTSSSSALSITRSTPATAAKFPKCTASS